MRAELTEGLKIGWVAGGIVLCLLAQLAIFAWKYGPEDAPVSLNEPVESARAEIRLLDGDKVFVTEWIAVRSAGQHLKHGIFRTLPIEVTEADGKARSLTYKVVGAELDGTTLPVAAPTTEGGHFVFALGSKDKELVVSPEILSADSVESSG